MSTAAALAASTLAPADGAASTLAASLATTALASNSTAVAPLRSTAIGSVDGGIRGRRDLGPLRRRFGGRVRGV